MRNNYIHFTGKKNEAQNLSHKELIRVSDEGYIDRISFRVQMISTFR